MNQFTPDDKKAVSDCVKCWAKSGSEKESTESVEEIRRLLNPATDGLKDKAAAEDQALTKAAGLAAHDDLDGMIAELLVAFAPPPSALLDAFALRDTDYWREPGPVIDWIVKDWLPGGRVSLLTGKGGDGKSKLALMLAAQLAMSTEMHSGEDRLWMAGGPMLGQPGRVVFASWEDDRATMRRRLCDWPQARGGDYTKTLPDLLDDRLVFRDLAAFGPLWSLEPNKGSRHTTIGELTPLGKRLRDDAANARLLIVDPLAGAFACNENDRGQVRNFMASWDAWARETRCAVLFIAHPAKTETGEGSEYSGSTDWFGAARSVLTLGKKDLPNHGKKKLPDNGKPRATCLECIKNNYGARPDPLRLDNWQWWCASPWGASPWGNSSAKSASYAPGELA